jgi:hypothetical protein
VGRTAFVARLRKILPEAVEEIFRIKGLLILKRNAARDYIDFAALADGLGDMKICHALTNFDELYPQKNGESALMQLQIQLAKPLPYDLEDTDLSMYKHLQPKWQHWESIESACAETSQILARELEKPFSART